ncbi:hypothetical protein CEXT_482191 [Caerostris extrusa]|uniref:Uncharacterized protein n=1 Tax=Caerostris extrusa TaxID=172846 RepID=A0AAV4W3M4_CAEEX|nr:hypothetical protein CEXT_482191 [Caerostris extrusa]
MRPSMETHVFPPSRTKTSTYYLKPYGLFCDHSKEPTAYEGSPERSSVSYGTSEIAKDLKELALSFNATFVTLCLGTDSFWDKFQNHSLLCDHLDPGIVINLLWHPLCFSGQHKLSDDALQIVLNMMESFLQKESKSDMLQSSFNKTDKDALPIGYHILNPVSPLRYEGNETPGTGSIIMHAEEQKYETPCDEHCSTGME